MFLLLLNLVDDVVGMIKIRRAFLEEKEVKNYIKSKVDVK